MMGALGRMMPTSRSPGTTPFGRGFDLRIEAELRQRAAGIGAVGLAAGDAEAEHVGVAQGEPAVGLVGNGQIERAFSCACLMPLTLASSAPSASVSTLPSPTATSRSRLLWWPRTLASCSPSVSSSVTSSRSIRENRMRSPSACARCCCAMRTARRMADAGLAGSGDGFPVGRRQMVLVADDLDFVARLQVRDQRDDRAVDLGTDGGVANVGVEAHRRSRCGVAPRGSAIRRPRGVKQKTWSWKSSSLVYSRKSSCSRRW